MAMNSIIESEHSQPLAAPHADANGVAFDQRVAQQRGSALRRHSCERTARPIGLSVDEAEELRAFQAAAQAELLAAELLAAADR